MVRVSGEVRQRFWDEVRAGKWVGEAGPAVGLSRHRGERLFEQSGGVMEPRRAPTGRFLSWREREEIAILTAQGHGPRVIGRRIGRSHTTVARELVRNSNKNGTYRAGSAHERAENRARRPKVGKLRSRRCQIFCVSGGQ